MIKLLVLIPERDNDGQPYPMSATRLLEWALVENFGGWSRRRSRVEGAWPMADGRIAYDVSAEYVVAVNRWVDAMRWLSLVQWACKHFRQEALYIEINGTPDVVDRPGDDDA